MFLVRAKLSVGGEPVHEVTVPDDLERLAVEMKPHDPALVWIDSLVTTLPDDMNSISYKDTAKALRSVGQWAGRHHLSVAAPWHLNKGSGTDTAIRMMDSRAFRTAARSVLLVVPDPEAPPHTNRGILALDKSNAGTLDVPAIRYEIVAAHYTVTEELGDGWVNVAATTGVLNWLGIVEGDGRAIARAALSPQDRHRARREGVATRVPGDRGAAQGRCGGGSRGGWVQQARDPASGPDSARGVDPGRRPGEWSTHQTCAVESPSRLSRLSQIRVIQLRTRPTSLVPQSDHY